MTPAASAYVSAVSVMLAAYGFFYGIYRERIDDAAQGGRGGDTPSAVEKRIREVKSARWMALWLGILPLVVWLIFLVPVVEEFEAAIDVCFSFDHYSALDIVFVVLANAWLPIAFILLGRAKKINGRLKPLDEDLKKLKSLNTRAPTRPAKPESSN